MGFSEDQMARRTPGEHFRGLGLCEPLDRLKSQPTGVGHITGTQLKEAAAIFRPTIDFVTDIQAIENVEAQQADMWCFQ